MTGRWVRRLWLADLRARHPIPDLPPPAPISPAFWDYRAHWDAAMAVAGWVTGEDWQAALVSWVKARGVR